MADQSLEERVILIVADKLGAKGVITRESSFREDLGADSLDVVELVMGLETAFEVIIPDTDVENIKNVGQVVDYIEAKLKTKEAAAATP